MKGTVAVRRAKGKGEKGKSEGVWVKRWGPVLVFMALSLAFFAEGVFSDRVFFGYDVHPRLEDTIGEKVSGLAQPMWNPQLGGFPQSEEIRPQYFPTYLIYLFSSSYQRHLVWRYVLTAFLAGWGMFLLLRELRVGRWAALWGGIAYLSAPTLLSFVFAGHYAKMAVIALFPLMCLLLERGLRRGGLGYFAGLGVVIAAAVYSPHLQMLYYALLGLGFFFLVRVGPGVRRQWQWALKRMAGFVLAVVLGLALGAEGLFPAYMYTRTESKRAAGSEAGAGSRQAQLAFARSWSLHPEEVGSLLVPEFGGFDSELPPHRYWGRNPL